MEGIEPLRQIIRLSDWMAKVDLKDSYLTVPIHEVHHRFLRFTWAGLKYQFNCLPIGLSSAPRVFTELLKPVVAWLRANGIRMIVYLDDFIFSNENRDALIAELKLAPDLLENLGFIINWVKSVTTPSQAMEFLGFFL